MKKALALVLVLVMILCLCACAQPAPARSGADQTTTTPTEGVGSEPHTITDMVGRKVEIPAEINTIAAVNSAARFLTYAGAVDKLVGVPDMDKDPQPGMPYSYSNKDSFANLVSTGSGGSGDTTYVEELVTLAPDLIFAYTSDVDALNDISRQSGLPVVGLYATDMFAQDFLDSLTLIGSIMGTEEHAARVVEAIKGWQKDLNDRTKDIPDEDKPTVYMGAMGFRGPHGFEGTCGEYPPFVAINAKNVVDETGEAGAMLIDLEKITVWNPDIIFINPSSMYLVNEDYAVNSAFYDTLTAVKEGRLYSQVSYNFNSTNMEIAIADAYYAGSIIYPDAFADIDFNAKAEEIFKTMLGMEYLSVLDEAGIGFGELTIGG